MEKKQWKTAAVSIITLVVLSLLVFWVFRDHYREIMEHIRAMRFSSLVILLSLGIGYQLLEAAVCFVLIRGQLSSFTYRQAVDVTFLRVFGNVATFSAGTIPMQSYYLHRCGLMAGSGVSTMTVEYVFHKASILAYATLMLLVQGRWISLNGAELAHYLMLGYVIGALIIAGLILACTWGKFSGLSAGGWIVFPIRKNGTAAKSFGRKIWPPSIPSRIGFCGTAEDCAVYSC